MIYLQLLQGSSPCGGRDQLGRGGWSRSPPLPQAKGRCFGDPSILRARGSFCLQFAGQEVGDESPAWKTMTWRTRTWLAQPWGVSQSGDRAIGFSSSLLPCATWEWTGAAAVWLQVCPLFTSAPTSSPCPPRLWVTRSKERAQRKPAGF